jgi:hypothetical protein
MPDMKNFNAVDYERRIAAIVENARRELSDLVTDAKEDIDVVDRAAAQLQMPSMDSPQPERLWVAEFAVEGHALEHDRGHLVQLSLPDSAAGCYPHGRQIKLQEFAGGGTYLPTGRYRAVVALIRLDPPLDDGS